MGNIKAEQAEMLTGWDRGQEVERGRGLIDSVVAVQQAGMPLFFPPPPICSEGLLRDGRTGGERKVGGRGQRREEIHHLRLQ